VRDAALKPVTVAGKEREGSFQATQRALGTAAPELGFVRPYVVDLTGWFDDFGHSGLVDALGGASRAAPHVNAFATTASAAGGLLSMTPLLTPEAQQENLQNVASLGQRNRCPGAVERGAAYKPSPNYNCDITQVPLGP
jgi:phospholipid/cholesterol/gamma-HCH transport system substrate-binding protein